MLCSEYMENGLIYENYSNFDRVQYGWMRYWQNVRTSIQGHESEGR